MIEYLNSIKIDRPRKLVFDYLTIPCYWKEYLPTTSNVKPAVKHAFNVGEQVTEHLNVLGVKVQILWTSKINDNLTIFEIDGISKNFGGSTSQLVYKLSEENGATIVKREIRLKFNNIIYRMTGPIWKFYFIFEAQGALRKARALLEKMPRNKSLEAGI